MHPRATPLSPNLWWEGSTAAPALLSLGQVLGMTLTFPPVTIPTARRVRRLPVSPRQERAKYSQQTPPKQLKARKREKECTEPDLDLNF